MSNRFESVAELKLKLMDDFQEFVPSTPQFQVGYIEGSSKQHWIISREDLDTMYESASDREVMIWCDKKSSEAQDHQGTRKRKSSEDGAPAPKASKSGEHKEELLRIVDQLMDKHANKYSIPQYRLWAKLVKEA